MLQIASVKYRRSSFFVKPASCETLFSRTSTSRFTPEFFSVVKKVSAPPTGAPARTVTILRDIRGSTTTRAGELATKAFRL